MSLDVVPAPDVYVNASVSLGTAPDHALRRLLGEPGQVIATEWILERVTAMLVASGKFKEDKVHEQVALIKSLVKVIDDGNDKAADDWAGALGAAASAGGLSRVMTDHPDLLASGSSGDIEFVACEAWLVEQTTPPPPPGI